MVGYTCGYLYSVMIVLHIECNGVCYKGWWDSENVPRGKSNKGLSIQDYFNK